MFDDINIDVLVDESNMEKIISRLPEIIKLAQQNYVENAYMEIKLNLDKNIFEVASVRNDT